MMPSSAPTTGPSASLFNRAPSLTPEALRDAIQRLTADQLNQLVREVDEAGNVPPIFRSAMVQRAIEDRITVADATREQWRALQRLIETTHPPAPSPAPFPPPPHAPLSFPPSPTPAPSGSITGDTGAREWAGDHKGIIAATAGLAILGFLAIRHIAKRREQFEREDKEDAERAGQSGATAPEARKRSFFWKLLIPGAAIGIPSAIAIKAYQNRKEIAAKAKEGAEKTQKAVKESAEAQEGIENSRYGLVSAGLILLDRDLMPESTRISDAQRRRILTNFLENQQVQNVPVSQVLNIETENDVGRVFGNVFRTADERHILFFLAKSCQKHREYVTNKARQLGLSDDEINQMPLIEYVDQLAEVSSTFGTLINEVATHGATQLDKINWENVLNPRQFLHHLKTDRIFMRRITEHYPELQTKENAFLIFCAANGNKTIHNLPQQLRENIPEDKKREWQMFQDILASMHQYVQDQAEYLVKFTHGEQRFADPLMRYLQNHLTVFDTVQLYYYMQQMLDENGSFRELKDSPYLTSFLLQTKIISMVKREDEEQGNRMFASITFRSTGAALGAATNIEIPEKAKQLFWNAAGTLTSAAHKMVNEAVFRGKRWYQEGVRTFPVAVTLGTAAGFGIAQLWLNNAFDAYDAKWFSRTPAEKIAARYGITLQTAVNAKSAARDSLGKTWLHNKFAIGFDTDVMHGQGSWRKPWKEGQGGVWEIIQRGQLQMDELHGTNITANIKNIQQNFDANGKNLEPLLKNAPNKTAAANIMRQFNEDNQRFVREGLDQMAGQLSKKGAKTFVELAEKEADLAQMLTRNLQKHQLVTAFGHKMSFISGGLNSIKQGARSRTKLFVPLLLLRALTSQEKIPIANLAGSTAIQLTPFVGTGYDVVTLVTGKDQITGEEISRWQSAGFVVIGTATDTLTALGFLFGAGIGAAAGVGARAAAFSARAGVKVVKAVKGAAKATEAMNQATRIALKAEKVAKVAKTVRNVGYTITIGNIGYSLISSDANPSSDSEEHLGGLHD